MADDPRQVEGGSGPKAAPGEEPTSFEEDALSRAATFRTEPTELGKARVRAGLSLRVLAEQAQCSLAYAEMVTGGYRPANPDAAPAYQRIIAVLENERRPDQTGARENGEAPPHVER